MIEAERRGDYLGSTVQMIPHGSDLVQKWIEEVAVIPIDDSNEQPDVCLIEVGGTVGDIESMLFLEALRQFQFTVGRENIMFFHVGLVPCLGSTGEQKSKPIQHSVKELRSLGLSPDVIVCRSSDVLLESTRRKIGAFCHVNEKHVISVNDVSNIYHIPKILVDQMIPGIIKRCLGLQHMSDDVRLELWAAMASTVDLATETLDGGTQDEEGVKIATNSSTVPRNCVKIAIVGKYTGHADAYLSVLKALTHSGIHLAVYVKIVWVDAGELTSHDSTSDAYTALKECQGVVVPGGFGSRGVEGKIVATEYCRTHKIPLLGVCLGMQVMVMEFARNVLGIPMATSEEFSNTKEASRGTLDGNDCDQQDVKADPAVPGGDVGDGDKKNVIVFMPEGSKDKMGGTMRVGARATLIKPGSLAATVYNIKGNEDGPRHHVIMERHRHRYEVDPHAVLSFEKAG